MKLSTIILTLIALAFTAIAIAATHDGTAEVNMCTIETQVEASNMSLAPTLPGQDAEQVETRCWKCGSGSSDGCSGGDKHCYGERSACQKKGCKITGSTSNCSSSKKTC